MGMPVIPDTQTGTWKHERRTTKPVKKRRVEKARVRKETKNEQCERRDQTETDL
jgi:hypothetical protein